VKHYEVELKAWIPHSRVVDPEEPARASSLLSAGVGGIGLNYSFQSHYRGDNHTGFAGSYRVLSKATFDWDGTTITNFRHVGTYGATHRDWSSRWSSFGRTIRSSSGTESKTASRATSGTKTGANSFSLNMASANPVIMTWAPDIDSSLAGTVDASGNVSLRYTTDLFPSHGLQIRRDGSVIKEEIVNDASGVNALGPVGAAVVGYRLSSNSNTGATTAP
jgi:hypothetical protein